MPFAVAGLGEVTLHAAWIALTAALMRVVAKR